MFERFTDRARGVLADTQRLATELKSPAIRRHHLLVALIDAAEAGSGSVAAVLADAEVDRNALRARLIESLTSSETPNEGRKDSLPFTAETKKAMELSLREALSLGHNYIGREHLLLGVLRDPEGPLASVLGETKLTHARAREIVTQESPPSMGRGRRGRPGRARGIRARFGRGSTEGLEAVLASAVRASGEGAITTGHLLVALLERPGTHFHAALAGVTLPDLASVTAQVNKLVEDSVPDGLEDALKVDPEGGVTIRDQRIADALKKIVGEGAVTPEQLNEILRRLEG
jgi:ATP-dependent Clp protease ATP-binding subunit ClpA